LTRTDPDRRRDRTARFGWLLLVLLPGAWALLARPLTPLEETRAAGVAWEMWLRGDFLVPYMNGAPYSHKPPLLFWLMQLGWGAFGVNDWWPRLVGPIATLVASVLAWRLAFEMRPEDRRFRSLAAWLLAGTLGWAFFGQMLMYDTLLTACVLTALIGAWRAGSGASRGAWPLVAIGLGLGILAKGPVALVHVLPILLLGPWWSAWAREKPRAWYGHVLLALAGGLVLAGAWAGIAAIRGGEEYARAILLEQTSGRVVDSFAHRRPWWAHLVFLPGLALPWVLLPASWKALLRGPPSPDRRFLLIGLLGSLAVLSAVSGKQPHYLVPVLPAIALLIAGGLPRGLTAVRVGAYATAAVAAMLLVATSVLVVMQHNTDFDMAPPAAFAASLQDDGIPLATTVSYKNQLAFPGRLRRPLELLERSDIRDWIGRHPDGVVVLFKEPLPDPDGWRVIGRFPYRRGEAVFWRREEAAGREKGE